MVDRSVNPQRSSGRHYLVATLVILIGLAASAYRINEPLWEDSHHGYLMAEYPQNAVNYLRHGYWNTGFGLVMNLGPGPTPEGYEYRVDHPPLSTILIAVSHQIFGSSDWSSRLPFILWNLAAALATYLLARLIVGRGWIALAALAFCAWSPVLLFYGRLPAQHGAAVCLSAIVFLHYWRWFASGGTRVPATLAVSMFVGFWIDWYAYLIPAVLAAHFIVFARRPVHRAVPVVLLALPIVGFLSFVAWAMWLKGGHAIEQLWERFVFRTVSGGPAGSDYVFTAGEFVGLFFERLVHWLTLPILVLTAVWIGRLMLHAIGRRVSAADGLIGSMFAAGFLHDLLLQNRVFIHDFTMVYQFAPAMALAAAAGLSILAGLAHRNAVRFAIVTAALGLFVWESASSVRAEHLRPAKYVAAYDVGRSLRRAVPEGQGFVDAAGLERLFDSHRAQAVADRPFLEAPSLNLVRDALDGPDPFAAVIIRNDPGTDPDLAAYLASRSTADSVAGFSIFRLDPEAPARPADTGGSAAVSHSGLELLDAQVIEVAEPSGSITWFDWYLNRHADRLPWNRTYVRITQAWRKVDDSAPASIRTVAVPSEGALPAIGPDGPGFMTAFPVSRWPQGAVIREVLTIEIPPHYPSGAYTVRVRMADRESTVSQFVIRRAAR